MQKTTIEEWDKIETTHVEFLIDSLKSCIERMKTSKL
jgi:hypothetical protein